MHFYEVSEPVGKCFDQYSSEYVDFRGLSQIIASLTRERLAERESEIHSLPWSQTEKENALVKCRLGLRAWRAMKPMLCLHAVTVEDGHPLESEDESGMRLCAYRGKIFEARVDGEQHPCHEVILQYVQTAPDYIQWQIDRHEFDEMTATKKESASGPDGIPYSFYKMCGRIGLPVLLRRV